MASHLHPSTSWVSSSKRSLEFSELMFFLRMMKIMSFSLFWLTWCLVRFGAAASCTFVFMFKIFCLLFCCHHHIFLCCCCFFSFTFDFASFSSTFFRIHSGTPPSTWRCWCLPPPSPFVLSISFDFSPTSLFFIAYAQRNVSVDVLETPLHPHSRVLVLCMSSSLLTTRSRPFWSSSKSLRFTTAHSRCDDFFCHPLFRRPFSLTSTLQHWSQKTFSFFCSSLSGNGFPLACFLCFLSEEQNHQWETCNTEDSNNVGTPTCSVCSFVVYEKSEILWSWSLMRIVSLSTEVFLSNSLGS